MVLEATRKGRAKIGHSSGGLEIVIPSRKNVILIIFLTAWLGGWALGAVMVGGSLFSGGDDAPKAFTIFWLAGWSVGGVWAALVLAWNLTGKETIIVSPTMMNVDKSVAGLHFRKAFNMSDIKEIRVVDRAMPFGFAAHEDFLFFRSGQIAFDYGMKTHRFGQGVEEAEARYLIDFMKESGYLK